MLIPRLSLGGGGVVSFPGGVPIPRRRVTSAPLVLGEVLRSWMAVTIVSDICVRARTWAGSSFVAVTVSVIVPIIVTRLCSYGDRSRGADFSYFCGLLVFFVLVDSTRYFFLGLFLGGKVFGFQQFSDVRKLGRSLSGAFLKIGGYQLMIS